MYKYYVHRIGNARTRSLRRPPSQRCTTPARPLVSTSYLGTGRMAPHSKDGRLPGSPTVLAVACEAIPALWRHDRRASAGWRRLCRFQTSRNGVQEAAGRAIFGHSSKTRHVDAPSISTWRKKHTRQSDDIYPWKTACCVHGRMDQRGRENQALLCTLAGFDRDLDLGSRLVSIKGCLGAGARDRSITALMDLLGMHLGL